MEKIPQVLVDLTYAFQARAGIPQSTRQTAWLLAKSKYWRTSALALSIHEQSRASLFRRSRKRLDAVGADAGYLASLIDAGQKCGSSLWTEFWRDLNRRRPRRFPLIKFTPGNWHEIFWEYYFAPGFPSGLRNELKGVDFYRSPLTRPEATMTARHNFPHVRLDTRGFDLVIFQNPTPIRLARGTIKVIRCHDLVPLLRFDTQPQDKHIIRDFKLALAQCARDSWFACVSEATRDALLDLFPQVRPRAVVIPNSIPVAEWVDAQKTIVELPHAFFLAVGTIEPRKNYLRLLRGFRAFRKTGPKVNRLVIVGGRGWRNSDEITEIEEAEKEGWLTWHKKMDAHALIDLYHGAHAFIGASVDEGFGMPPLESAALGTPCVLSDLRVFRDHFGDTAEYFDPYDPDSLAKALTQMTPARRAELAPLARTRALHFGPDNEAAQWQELIRRVVPGTKIPAPNFTSTLAQKA